MVDKSVSAVNLLCMQFANNLLAYALSMIVSFTYNLAHNLPASTASTVIH